MTWDLVIFYALAIVCLLCAIGVIAAKNPVHSAIFLVLCFFNVAGVFVLMGAEFLAAIQIIIYTGAILVLMLFVLMLVDPDDLPELHEGRPVQRVLAVILGLILFLETAVAIVGREVLGQKGQATRENIQAVGGNTQALGRVLYSNYLLAFEVVSLVLTVAVIGAIVLALPERLGAQLAGRRQATISLGHPRGTDPVAALPGGIEQSPIPVADGQGVATPVAGRRLVMVKDPDEFTGAK